MPEPLSGAGAGALLVMWESCNCVAGLTPPLDQDTVTGFLLAGIGHKDRSGTNFLVVDSSAFPCLAVFQAVEAVVVVPLPRR